MSWMEFTSRKQLAAWLLFSDQGLRFLSWFFRKYYKSIMNSEAGNAAYEWIRSEVIREEQERGLARRIVIERFPDGFIKVYGEKTDVVFIHRLIVASDKALELDEQLAELSCPKRAKETYDGRVLATDFYQGRTVEQEAKRRARIAISAALGRSVPTKDRANPKLRSGDSVVGAGRISGNAGGV